MTQHKAPKRRKRTNWKAEAQMWEMLSGKWQLKANRMEGLLVDKDSAYGKLFQGMGDIRAERDKLAAEVQRLNKLVPGPNNEIGNYGRFIPVGEKFICESCQRKDEEIALLKANAGYKPPAYTQGNWTAPNHEVKDISSWWKFWRRRAAERRDA